MRREPIRNSLPALILLFLTVPGFAAPPVTALVVAPEGTVVLDGSQAGIGVRSVATLKPTGTLPTDIPNVHDIVFSPDGNTFAVAGGIPGKRGLVELYSWPGAKKLHSAAPHRDSVYKVAWSADGTRLYTAGGDAVVCQLDVTLKTTRTFEGHSKGVLAVALLSNGTLVSAGLDETVRVWDVATGEVVRSLSNHTKPVTDLAVRPGQPAAAPPTVVSVSEDRTVRLWQPTLGRMVKFARLDVAPTAVAWSKDGSKVFVACKDGKLRVLDSDLMEVVDAVAGIDGVAYAVAVSSAGQVYVAGQGGQVRRAK